MANYSRFHPKTFKFTIEDLLKIYVPSNDLGLFKTNGKLNIHLIDASGNQKNWKTRKSSFINISVSKKY